MLTFHAILDRIFHKRVSFSIFFRIWLSIAIVIVLASSLAYYQLQKTIKPTAQRVVEDTLVDISRMLAVSIRYAIIAANPPPVAGNTTPSINSLDNPQFRPLFQHQLSQIFSDNTIPISGSNLSEKADWYDHKTQSQLHIYVTDAHGIVLYDSQNQWVGQDFSRWNDVYLTLHGKYGARSTKSDPNDPTTSVMYVASPIVGAEGRLMGVVSVGKPVATLMPYIKANEADMIQILLSITGLLLGVAVLVAWWLRHSIWLVNRYTQHLVLPPTLAINPSPFFSNKLLQPFQPSKKALTRTPFFYLGKELNQLIYTIDDMKLTIENKGYVTDYVHTLTHELKSPLTAIRASAELLGEDLPAPDRVQFSQTILQQSDKLQQLVEQLLLLAKIEQPTFKLNPEPCNLAELCQLALANQQAWRQQKQLACQYVGEPNIMANVDKFWLSQAVQNLLDNAIKFANQAVLITAVNDVNNVTIQVVNDSPTVPDYVLEKAFERYFSLPPTAETKTNVPTPKGTGLGLTLTQQVVERHQGTVRMQQMSFEQFLSQINNIPNMTAIQDGLTRHHIAITQNCIVLTVTLPC